MVFHKFWLVFVGFQGGFMFLYVDLRFPAVFPFFQGVFMIFHGLGCFLCFFQGGFMVLHDFQLVFMVFQGTF